jgi:predicted RNase H-like HicB family nuclease
MKKIYGYYFAIIAEKGDSGYIAYAPGVGGVYEEGRTKKEAQKNAYEAACAIFETRLENNDPITQNNKYLTIINKPPTFQNIAANIKKIPDGYIATPICSLPACANA